MERNGKRERRKGWLRSRRSSGISEQVEGGNGFQSIF